MLGLKEIGAGENAFVKVAMLLFPNRCARICHLRQIFILLCNLAAKVAFSLQGPLPNRFLLSFYFPFILFVQPLIFKIYPIF